MNFYLSRINGYAIITFILGIASHYLLGKYVLVFAVPLLIWWLSSYDVKSYERSVQNVGSRRD